MELCWKNIMASYGQSLTLIRGEEESQVRAFFQPASERAPGERPTPLGVAPVGKWLYLGPPEETLEGVSRLRWDGRTFLLLRERGFPVGERMAYRWALFEEEDGGTA